MLPDVLDDKVVINSFILLVVLVDCCLGTGGKSGGGGVVSIDGCFFLISESARDNELKQFS